MCIIKNPGEEPDRCGFIRLLTATHRAPSDNVIVPSLVTDSKCPSDRLGKIQKTKSNQKSSVIVRLCYCVENSEHSGQKQSIRNDIFAA